MMLVNRHKVKAANIRKSGARYLRFKARSQKAPVALNGVIRTLAMLPDPVIPRCLVRFEESDGSYESSEVMLAADIVFD